MDEMDNICPICFDEFDDKQIASTNVCDHLFCFSCLEKWAKLGSYCPVDRKRFKKIIKLNSDDVVQVKPRRRKKKNRVQYDVTAFCEYCKLTTSSATLLLCDSCDLAYHCECLTPPLTEVPAGLWFCPPCVAVDERLKKRNGISKESETEFKPQNEKDPPTFSSSCSEDSASQSKNISMHKLSPWKKKNFEETINPYVSEDECPSLPQKLNNPTEKIQNGSLRVVVEKLNVASLKLINDSTINVPPSERPVRTESFLGQKSSTCTSEDASSYEPEQELTSKFSSEENVAAKNCLSQVNDNDKFPVQKYETKIVAVVPENKNFQFSVFQKLEDISLSELKYSELATVTNNPKSNTPCDICKVWKMKNRTDRLEKLLQKKKLLLNKHSLMKSPSKSESRINHHVRNSLISEIQKIQQKKWKLKENYNLKKRRIMRQLKKQLKMTTSTTDSTHDLLSAMPYRNEKISNINEEPNSSCRTTHRDIKQSKSSSKSLSGMVEMSSDALEACEKSTYEITAAPKLWDQAHSSKDSLNIYDKAVKSEEANNMLQKPFHMSDLKRIVIRSDGSLFLDYPENT
ncbi:uncharacterized protein LOC129219306 [Uloborus diversus]|uniref:uncharacterized protein LOC129219306 n=1 Tax=Uloborus diversus TaxID=327109 RepID=UPI002409C2FD|nr:uncharacterized protein LOC129219306 [Uloborus diversus]